MQHNLTDQLISLLEKEETMLLAFSDDLNRQDYHADRFEACEDDVEFTCPFVELLPEESDKESGSPLDFRNY